MVGAKTGPPDAGIAGVDDYKNVWDAQKPRR